MIISTFRIQKLKIGRWADFEKINFWKFPLFALFCSFIFNHNRLSLPKAKRSPLRKSCCSSVGRLPLQESALCPSLESRGWYSCTDSVRSMPLLVTRRTHPSSSFCPPIGRCFRIWFRWLPMALTFYCPGRCHLSFPGLLWRTCGEAKSTAGWRGTLIQPTRLMERSRCPEPRPCRLRGSLGQAWQASRHRQFCHQTCEKPTCGK